MLESLTIFSPGGIIYYQYTANPSLFNTGKNNKKKGNGGKSNAGAAGAGALAAAGVSYDDIDDSTNNSTTGSTGTTSNAFTEHNINQILINKIFLHPLTYMSNGNGGNSNSSNNNNNNNNTNTNNYHIEDNVTFVWMNEKLIYRNKEKLQKIKRTSNDTISLLWGRFVVVAIYPDIIFDGPRLYLKNWANKLISTVCIEYSLLLDTAEEQHYNNTIQQQQQSKNNNNENNNRQVPLSFIRPDPELFDKTFRLLLKASKSKSGLNNNNSITDLDGSENDDNDFYEEMTQTTTTTNNNNNTKSKQQQQQYFQIVKEKNSDGTINTRIVLNDTIPTTTATTATAAGATDISTGNTRLPQHMLDTNKNDNTDDLFRTNAADLLVSKQQNQQQVSSKNKKKNNTTGGTTTTTKEKRNWHDGTAVVTEKAMAQLDYNANDGGTSTDAYNRALREARAAYLPTSDDLNVDYDTNNIDNNALSTIKEQTQTSTFFSNLFQTLTLQNKILTVSDLQKPCEQLKQLLQSKNVANTIASEIAATVLQQLTGKTLKALYSVDTAIQQAVTTSIERIVFHTTYDLLRNIVTKKEMTSKSLSIMSRFGATSATTTKLELERKHRPYVISVMGINGIGKTTTIAKLAYYIQSNTTNTSTPLRPMLVACDTFRSGAVEQLKIHSDCLNIPFYSQGYSKDPASVAAQAIYTTTQNNIAIATGTQQQGGNGNEYIDVLLIDTAGRMQNNVPLMKALNKLVVENKPDCCLLVCEALVGHDGLNQYDMFSKAAGGYGISSSSSTAGTATGNRRTTSTTGSTNTNPGIHGLILTKFDTVDTKVGAAITLTYETSTPIVFIGTGQKYHHLTKLTSNTIVSSLFTK